MKNKYDEAYTSSFIKGITKLTGLSERKLIKYADENNLFNILEHPNIIEPNKQQLEKINLLNEFISSYKLLKLQEKDNKIVLNSSSITGEYFVSLLGGIKDKEKFMAAFLDSGNNIIETRTFSEGSIGEAVVYPRMILKAALDCDCKSIILAHNHPGGSLSPSIQDKQVTQNLVSIFSPLHISILDHIIVANIKYISMAESGLIPHSPSNKASYAPMSLADTDKNNEELNKGYDYPVTKSDINLQSEYYFEQDNEEESEWEI